MFIIEATSREGEVRFIENVSDFDLTPSQYNAETFSYSQSEEEIFNLINEDRSQPGDYSMEGYTFAIREVFMSLGEPTPVHINKPGWVIRSGSGAFVSDGTENYIQDRIGATHFAQFQYAKVFTTSEAADDFAAEIRASTTWPLNLFIERGTMHADMGEEIIADFYKGV